MKRVKRLAFATCSGSFAMFAIANDSRIHHTDGPSMGKLAAVGIIVMVLTLRYMAIADWFRKDR